MAESAWGLKPCPFCGFKGPHLTVHPGVDDFRYRYSVLCDYRDGGCGTDGPWYHRQEEAVDAWNRRVAKDNNVRGKSAEEAIPVKPLAQWLAGYAAPPGYALEETRLEKDFLTPDHMTRAWEHHLHTLMESGLMEEEKET